MDDSRLIDCSPLERREPARSRPRAGRAWGRWLGLASALVVLIVAGLELALRSQGYCTRPAIYYDPEIGYRGRPNQQRWMLLGQDVRGAPMTTNEHGFRGVFPPRERTPGVPRIVTLGDSMTFGLGVEDDQSYPEQLRARLESLPWPGRAEVLNVSFPGWNVENALGAYRAIASDYRPDVVIMGFTMDDLRPTGHGVRYMDLPLLRHAWRSAIGELLQLRLLPKLPGFRIQDEPELVELRRGYAQAVDVIPRDPTTELARPYLERSMAALAELDRAVAADGGRLGVVCLPGFWQVAALRGMRPGEERDARRAELTRMQATVRLRCIALGIPFHDALDALIESRANPFGELDPSHPGPLGYRLLAETIADWLLDAGLLRPPGALR